MSVNLRGGAKGSHVASRQGRFGAGAQDRVRAEQQAREHAATAPPLPLAPPAWMPARAKRVWVEYRPLVHGACSASDAELFAAWCLACADVRRYARSRKPDAERRCRVAQRAMLSASKDLGMSPASRSRLPSPRVGAETDHREATIAALVV